MWNYDLKPIPKGKQDLFAFKQKKSFYKAGKEEKPAMVENL